MTHILNPAILREYDIRGTVGRTLGEDDAYAVGRSFATRVRRAGGIRVAVGRDGRLTSPMLEAALVRGLTEGGVDVVRIGIGPSPMLYWAEATLEVDGGVQVTGSHNPRDDNGFKMMLMRAPFYGEDVKQLAELAAAGDWSEGAGSVADVDVLGDYVARLVAGGQGGAFRIGWDAGNGAAGPAIEQLVKLLPGEHHLLFTDVDGEFPHHHPDPTKEANLAALKALVAERTLDFGVAFDGDGDRIGAVDAHGRVVWGDQLLAILADPVLRALPGAPIIADVKSSARLFERIAELGGEPVMWKTGHSNLKVKMKELGAPLAGEASGHIFFGHDWYGFDDALYAAVRLIGAVHLAGRTLAELVDAMPIAVATPELRFAVPEGRRWAVIDEVRARLEQAGATVDTTDGVRVTTPAGWWLLRASNTEDMLTARAEADDQDGLDQLVAEIDAALAASGVRRR
ncbi:phosphomannomutase [Sphingomonas jinjuensis]|uniref:Phosphomannomutase n=1 Tax=Sphingomonas jinjuensis TaxID=535907 RepID=A0A840EZN4_9SPHN|nr:phosphomannomutase [Sphingomonas jinjuensis]